MLRKLIAQSFLFVTIPYNRNNVNPARELWKTLLSTFRLFHENDISKFLKRFLYLLILIDYEKFVLSRIQKE